MPEMLEEGARKRCSECWGKVPESDARSVGGRCRKAMFGVLEEGAGKRCSERAHEHGPLPLPFPPSELLCYVLRLGILELFVQ